MHVKHGRVRVNLPNFFAELQRRHVYRSAPLCRGRLARRPDRHAGLSDFRSVRAGAAIIVLVIVAGFPLALFYMLFDITPRASCEPTTYQRLAKATPSTREGGHGSQDDYVLALLLVTAIGYFVLDRTASTRFGASYQQCEVDCGLPLVIPAATQRMTIFRWPVGELIAVSPRFPARSSPQLVVPCSRQVPTTAGQSAKSGRDEPARSSVRNRATACASSPN